uniref:Longin domain-containing protein n=2 Tax=gambiae species complex TaxID=44542 RepID=A0A8W7PZB9_ANOCL
MALMTMIARFVDGLPLVGTMQEDEQSGRSILEYQNQAKLLFRKLGPNSPTRCSIETGPYLFHYLIEHDVCYLVMCDKVFSKRIAFTYLEDIAQEFHSNYGRRKYKKDASYLNRKSLYVKGAVAGIILILFVLYFWVI